MPKLSDIIKQTIGDSETDLMSQVGVTQAIANAVSDEADSRQGAIAYAIANINTTPTFYDTQSALDWLTVHGNFRNTKFSEFELNGYSFAGSDFSGASFYRMTFHYCNFANANFFACEFDETMFKYTCILSGINFDNAVFKGFSGSDGPNYISSDYIENAVALGFYFISDDNLPGATLNTTQAAVFQMLNSTLTMNNGRISANGVYYHAYYSIWVSDNEPIV